MSAAAADEWPLVRLGEISDLFDGPHQTAPLTPDGPVVYLNVGDIRGGRVALRLSGRVNDDTARAWSMRVTPEPGDVVFGYEATLGHAAILTGDHRWCLGRRVGLLRPRRDRVDPHFLLYAWYSPRFQDTLRANRVGGTTIESLRLTDLPSWTIALPNLHDQRRIAGILGTLDDKIELSRRMSETLEATARALFKSWFVDFDPVRAKAEDRDTRLPRAVVAMFPDSFEVSCLGEIPAGWHVAPLSDCVDVDRGLSYKGSGLSGDGVPMHNLNSIYEGGGYKHAGLKHYTGEYKARHVARAGDLLVANTEQGHDRRLIGFAALVPLRFGVSGLYSHHIFRVRTRSHLPSEYLCHLLNTRVMHDTVSGYANGTTVNTLPIDALQAPLVVVPPRDVVSTFAEFASATRERQEGMMEESQTISDLRDALLPRLISGELRLKDADQLVEAVSA